MDRIVLISDTDGLVDIDFASAGSTTWSALLLSWCFTVPLVNSRVG